MLRISVQIRMSPTSNTILDTTESNTHFSAGVSAVIHGGIFFKYFIFFYGSGSQVSPPLTHCSSDSLRTSLAFRKLFNRMALEREKKVLIGVITMTIFFAPDSYFGGKW